jgi:hypothetical protein
MTLKEAASRVSIAAFLGDCPDFGIREFVLPHQGGSALLNEEYPWIEIREDGWYIQGKYKLPCRLKSKIKFRALKLLRQSNRRE